MGQPLGFFHGYKTDGIFQNQEQIDAYIWTDPETGATQKIMPDAQPGDVIFKDLNNNGVIDDGDKTFIGDPHPDVTYGLSITLGYKGFDFAVTGYGVAGNQIAKSYRNNTNTTFDNYTTEILGRWHGEGTSNRLPAIDGSAINYGYVSDLYIEDGDYFRISNVTLGYDFTRLFKSKYISQLRRMQACKISSPSPTTRAWTPKSDMEAATIGPRASTSVTIPEPAPICLASTSNSNSNFKTRLICKKNQRYEKDIVFYNRCHVAHQL